MSQGNRIILTQDRGYKVEGIINAGETPKPGTVYQIDPTQTKQGGRWVWKKYTRGADGKRPAGPYIVLTEDILQGKTMTDAYAAGDRAFGFVPLPGCELNLLFNNVAGTGDTVTAGNLVEVVDASGKVEVTTGSPQSEVGMFLETYTNPTADKLLWSIWSGY